jgi:hypothetical protein
VAQYTNVMRLMGMSVALQHVKHDPEDTLNMALTHREVALLVTGLLLVEAMMPEFGEWADALFARLRELSDFQEFRPGEFDPNKIDPEDYLEGS